MTLWHKAVSVRAPWAWLIATGRKRFELRSRSTDYRGPLLICAGAQPSSRACIVGSDELEAALAAPRRVALCLVDLVDCRPATPEDRTGACCEPEPGEWVWVLARPRLVEPMPVSGALGFFWVDEHGRRGRPASESPRPLPVEPEECEDNACAGCAWCDAVAAEQEAIS